MIGVASGSTCQSNNVSDSAGTLAISDLVPGRYRAVVVDRRLEPIGLTVPTAVRFIAARDSTYAQTVVLPTAEESRVFLADRDLQKRDRLIDSLFERAEFVDFWTLRWGDLLRSSRKYLSDRALAAFRKGDVAHRRAKAGTRDVFLLHEEIRQQKFATIRDLRR